MANNFPTIKPSLNLQFANTGILPPDVTFTRASSSGGYYDGKTVVKAEENLLLYSQEFDNAYWAKNGAAITANTTVAPDGTTTAETLNEGGSAGQHNVGTTTFVYANGTIYTHSVFVKADTATVIQFAGQSVAFGVNAFANFDLTAGILGTVGSSATATITAVGADWYRITMTATCIANTTQTASLLSLVNNDAASARVPSYTGTSNQLFIWGAQLERRDSVTAYTPTTTQPITRFQPKLEYAIANEPVFDHNPVTGEALGLSVWEARTNLLLRSEEFDNAGWGKVNSTVTANTIVAPSGELTGDKWFEDTATSTHQLSQNTNYTSGVTYTYSFYAKKGERSIITMFENVLQGIEYAKFNLDTGVATTFSNTVGWTRNAVSMAPVGNGWYRCVVTATPGLNITNNAFITRMRLDNGTTTNYTGDGYSGIYIWGAQLEAGAFATPYIPTTTATVTRSADRAVMTGANFSRFYRADEGTFVVEGQSSNTGNARYLMTSNTSGDNRLMIYTDGASGITASATTNGVAQALMARTGLTITNFNKFAFSYKTDDFAAVGNGGAVGTDTLGVVPPAATLHIGVRETGATQLSGYIKFLQYYPARLTNAQLQAVTA